MKKILIIGNSLSAWSVASAFTNKKVNITIIGNKNNTFGAQQLSPNGFRALKKLIQNDDVKNIVYEIIKFQINSYNNNETTVSREMLINFLIKNVKNNIQINEINKSCVGIIQREPGKLEVLMDNKEFISADIIIGCDGVNGITRKYVCGTTNIVIENKYY